MAQAPYGVSFQRIFEKRVSRMRAVFNYLRMLDDEVAVLMQDRAKLQDHSGNCRCIGVLHGDRRQYSANRFDVCGCLLSRDCTGYLAFKRSQVLLNQEISCFSDLLRQYCEGLLCMMHSARCPRFNRLHRDHSALGLSGCAPRHYTAVIVARSCSVLQLLLHEIDLPAKVEHTRECRRDGYPSTQRRRPFPQAVLASRAAESISAPKEAQRDQREQSQGDKPAPTVKVSTKFHGVCNPFVAVSSTLAGVANQPQWKRASATSPSLKLKEA